MSGPPRVSESDIPDGRVGGIDYGRRRIGIAVCDAARILSSPLAVREASGDQAAEADYFRRLAVEEELSGFVVGLPLHTDGRESEMSREALQFAAWLAEVTGLPVEMQDERYTSAEAAGRLAGVGLSRERRRRLTDAVAAQILLADWMRAAGDRRRRSLEDSP
jgi:putative Holliday junction resolvase